MIKHRVKLQGYVNPKIYEGFLMFKKDMGITSDSYAINQIIGGFLNVELEKIPDTALEKIVALFERVSILESKLEYADYLLKQKCSP